MQKIVVFDFDKTLTVKDTNLLFFTFVGRTKSFYYFRLIIYIVFVIIRKFRLISNTLLKNVGLLIFINGKTEKEINELSYNFSRSIKLKKPVVNILKNYITDGKRVIIITASIDKYVKAIFPDVEVIGSLLDFESKYIKLKNHCYHEEKINRLKNIGIFKINILFTDSISDLPLVRISDKINMVNNTDIIECYSEYQFIKAIKK